MSKVAVIIVTYNGMQWIDTCLKSISDEYRVIVVDNASIDKTVSFIKSNYPKVALYCEKENLGFGRANNLGIRHALKDGADRVFLLNQDAYLEKGTVEELVKIQEQQPSYGILSPVHLNGKGDKLDLNFSKYVTHEFYSDYILRNPLKSVYSVPFVNAAGWLLSKSCINMIGGFDPIFFHYGEDDNYCQRVLYHGFKIGVVPDVFLKHDREFRKNNHNDTTSEKFNEILEKRIKINQANINIPSTNELNRRIKNRKWSVLKSYLKLNFKAAAIFRNEYILYKKIVPEITLSRKTNKTKGSHYI